MVQEFPFSEFKNLSCKWTSKFELMNRTGHLNFFKVLINKIMFSNEIVGSSFR